MSDLQRFDGWLQTDTTAALVIREPLVPVEGPDGVFFPATFAASEDKKTFPGGFNIDPPQGDKNVCLVDSVGSQSNRVEPLFQSGGYAELVPQIVIEAGDRSVNLLEAGHRAGDAVVRSTGLQKQLQSAFLELLRGDASPLAKIAPTSLVFGVWDSRDTQAKLPRIFSSTIRAFDVQRLTRSAQYTPALDYVGLGLLEDTAEKKTKDAYSERGFVHVPSSGTPGGVIARGGIRRDGTLSLAALRQLCGDDDKATLSLRRYVLGLALVAFTAPTATYLRQGCNLVPDPDNPRTTTTVYSNGTRESLALAHQEAFAYAKVAAREFGVGASHTVQFDANLAKSDIDGKSDVKQTRKRAARQSS